MTSRAVNVRVKGLRGQRSATVQAFIDKVVAAAHSAIAHGLDPLALAVAPLLLSGVLALLTGDGDPEPAWSPAVIWRVPVDGYAPGRRTTGSTEERVWDTVAR